MLPRTHRPLLGTQCRLLSHWVFVPGLIGQCLSFVKSCCVPQSLLIISYQIDRMSQPTHGFLQAQQQLFAAMSATGIPRRYTHCLASFMPQDEWQYAQQLADLAANSTANGTLQSSQPCHHGDGCHCVSCNKSRQAGEITCSSTAQHSACNHHHAGAAQHPHHQQRAMVTDDSHVCKQSTVTKDVRSSSCKQRQSDAERQDSRDARLPQDRQLLAMPDHIRRLGMSVSATILERPDTFR